MRLWPCLALLLGVACGDDPAPRGSSTQNALRDAAAQTSSRSEDQGGMDIVDASLGRVDAGLSSPRRRQGSGAAAGSGGGIRRMPNAATRDADTDADADADSGSAPDASAQSLDAGKDATTPEAPETLSNNGSCCSASQYPGCGDADLQACVCALQPSCCSEAWDDSCTRIVRERNCQPGVRDCVCGSGKGQWQQTECCQGDWSSTCESVAINKCAAISDCS